MSPAAQLAGSTLAVTRVGEMTVAVEADRVAGFHSAGDREPDADLTQLLGLPRPADASERLIELSHPGGRLLLAVHGTLRLTTSEQVPRCHRPTLIIGALRRSCLRGVLHHDAGLIYLLDVDEIAARIGSNSVTSKR
jgi:chemotaxis signal transduction protein